MPDVRPHSEFDSVCLKLLGGRRTAHATRMLPACVLGDSPLLCRGTTGKQLSHAPRECGNVLSIEFLTPFGRPLPRALTRFRVGQALLFRSCQRIFLHQYALAFIAFARTAETHDNRPEPRIAACTPGQCGVPSPQKHQMIQVRAFQTQGTFPIQPEKASLAQFLTAFGAC
jgi:hypothetical protein